MGIKKIQAALFLGVLLGSILCARADHITGGEMYYKFAGIQNGEYIYNVTLRLLMRCNSGRNFPNPISISIFSKDNNARVRDIAVPLANQAPISLFNYDPCISNPPNVCYDVATYYFDISVPGNEQGYIISAQVNFRVNGLANLFAGSGNIGATYTAEIPGTVGPREPGKNNSAQFTGSDLVVVCANSPFTYSFAASDSDDDKLRYIFCDAYQSGTSGGGMNSAPPIPPPYQLVPYGDGFAGDKPLGGRVTIDAETGLVSGVAPDPGIYVITVCVEEIRDGVVIASQRKDIQLNITGCTIAAALLAPDYQLCGETNQLTFENLSASPLIQAYAWRIVNRQGATVATSNTPQFTHSFRDTGLYRISLNTNTGLPCPDSTSSEVRYYPGFKADFNFVGQCFGSPTSFTDISSTRYGSIISRNWQLGEPQNAANNSQAANPGITYASQGFKTASLRIENSNGCTANFSKQLSISAEPPLQFAFRDTLICPPDTLQLRAFGEGVFTWSPAPGLLSGGSTSAPRVAPLQTTWFRVIQRIDNCVGTDSVQVRVLNNVSLSLMQDTTICLGDSVRLRLTGNAIQYQWSPTQQFRDARIMQPFVRPITPTVYRVRGTISNCFAEAELLVTPVPYPSAKAGTSQAICFGNSIMLNTDNAGDRIVWSPANSLSNANIPDPIASPVITTTYVMQVFENRGCPKPAIDTVRIVVEPPINLSVTRDTNIVVGQPLQLNGTGASRYLWIPATGLSDATIGNPTITFTQPREAMNYLLIGYNDAGCRDSLTVSIRVFANGPSIYVPTAFTPNSDGLNELLKPTIAGMQQLTFFKVFNRYGELVFNSSIPYKGWDGIWKGQKQPSGHYVWMVQAIDYEGNVIKQKGTSMLIR
jgi:gliding motility-associated-like protein